MDCYILHTVLLLILIILLLIIAIICYHLQSKGQNLEYEMKSNEFKKFIILLLRVLILMT